jgi:hypothetical protein
MSGGGTIYAGDMSVEQQLVVWLFFFFAGILALPYGQASFSLLGMLFGGKVKVR